MTGAPKGLVLRRILFSIVTPAVGTLISTFVMSHHQFADDTQLYIAIKLKTNENLVALSKRTHAATGWRIENDLLNAAKTESLAIGTRQQIAKLNLSGGMVLSGSTVPLGKKKTTSTRIDAGQIFDI